MSPGSNTKNYPAFAHIGLRENSNKKPQPDLPEIKSLLQNIEGPVYVLRRDTNAGLRCCGAKCLSVTPDGRLCDGVELLNFNGLTELVFFENGSLTARRYIGEILADHVVFFAPFMNENFALMHDNARSHAAWCVTDYLKLHNNRKSKNSDSTATRGNGGVVCGDEIRVSTQPNYRRVCGGVVPDAKSIRLWFNKLLTTDSVLKQSGRAWRSEIEGKVEEIRAGFQRSSSKSIRQASRQFNVPPTNL
ncbi:hypothetical protein ANN_11195 [Periplaneta americana]|uniref:Tc1-like transposase DDE domain-containing protein n=1 Tax=Periplaneta americana TaxID=6978 RepID=A0ABQ8T4B9_PERAM|nr:hypothetical protein ANN_11195 [Periplaneta americana]